MNDPSQPKQLVLPVNLGDAPADTRPQEPRATDSPEPAAPKRRPRWHMPRGRTPEERMVDGLAQLGGEEEPKPPDDLRIYPALYQLKITLKGIRPPIWRRVLVPSNVTLARLHRIIQNTMGWWNYHLYAFTIDEREYSEGEDFYDAGFLQAAGRRLFELDLRPGHKFNYDYDFGDDWQHDVLVERVLRPGLSERYPICVGGRRGCPPEDCGGPWGYTELLEVLADPMHEEHEAMRRWVGDSFDAERFDIEIANMRLQQTPLRPSKSARDRALAWRSLAFATVAPKRQRRQQTS